MDPTGMEWWGELFAAVAAAVLAITLHEAAHGFAARALGDDTAERMGRLSLNPLRHVDPVGTVLVPGFLLLSQLLTIGQVQVMFGWAKPVPVNPWRLRDPRFGMVAVAAAGPAINGVLALLAALLLHLATPGDLVFRFLFLLLLSNLVLGLFNLLPIPPMDGGRIVGGLLPPALGEPFLRLQRLGLLGVIVLLFVLPQLVPAWDPMGWLLRGVVSPALEAILRLTGHIA